MQVTAFTAKSDATKADTLHFVHALEQAIPAARQRGGEVPLAMTGKFKAKTTAEAPAATPRRMTGPSGSAV